MQKSASANTIRCLVDQCRKTETDILDVIRDFFSMKKSWRFVDSTINAVFAIFYREEGRYQILDIIRVLGMKIDNGKIMVYGVENNIEGDYDEFGMETIPFPEEIVSKDINEICHISSSFAEIIENYLCAKELDNIVETENMRYGCEA